MRGPRRVPAIHSLPTEGRGPYQKSGISLPARRTYTACMGTSAGGAADRAEREILRLCQAGLDARTLAVEAIGRLKLAIPLDAFFWASADPATLLFTGSVVQEI